MSFCLEILKKDFQHLILSLVQAQTCSLMKLSGKSFQVLPYF